MLPRSEYPRPRFKRDGWMNLNGEWEFETDPSGSGLERGVPDKPEFDRKITVPFCPESRLSGIGDTDFMPHVWYRRRFDLPEAARGKRVFINFGAVDYEASVYVNGALCGSHTGGYTGFQLEITSFLVPGENTIVLKVDDPMTPGLQPRGKQSDRYASYGCVYTRTTGIWQTVWLEWTEATRITGVKITPDAVNASALLEIEADGELEGCEVTAEASFEGEYETEAFCQMDSGRGSLTLLIEDPRLWQPGEGNLYDVKLCLRKDGQTLDTVYTYFGLRSVQIQGGRMLINGRPVFQRLVLDQGFYPDGIYTAPSDEALKNDILLSMAMGFNGARLHQKVFEERFLYHADKLGYLVWGEFPSWGIEPDLPESADIFISQWLEALRRDYSAPSVIGWCPWNETWHENGHGMRARTQRLCYLVTKAYDPTRPVIDSSGGTHVIYDIYDAHDYTQDVETYRERFAPGAKFFDNWTKKHYEGGKPVFISEYGGIGWNPDGAGWGYGSGPQTGEEFIERYRGLTETLLDNPRHIGFCYTQLTDVEQERNGLYYYDRRHKFDPDIIRSITARKAAYEDT